MQSDPHLKIICPFCGDGGFTRWNLPLHIVNEHGAEWKDAQALTLASVRDVRRMEQHPVDTTEGGGK